MATQAINAGRNAGALPVACALTADAVAAQAMRWELLAARAMTERAETAHGLRIIFRPGPGVEEELRELTAVEQECCRWAAWTVRAGGGQVVLDVRSAGDGIATLHGMFSSMQPAPAACPD